MIDPEIDHRGMLDRLGNGEALPDDEIVSFMRRIVETISQQSYAERRKTRDLFQFWASYYRAKNGFEYSEAGSLFRKIMTDVDPPILEVDPRVVVIEAWTVEELFALSSRQSPSKSYRSFHGKYRVKSKEGSLNPSSVAFTKNFRHKGLRWIAPGTGQDVLGYVVHVDHEKGTAVIASDKKLPTFSLDISLLPDHIREELERTGKIEFRKMRSRRGQVVVSNFRVAK